MSFQLQEWERGMQSMLRGPGAARAPLPHMVPPQHRMSAAWAAPGPRADPNPFHGAFLQHRAVGVCGIGSHHPSLLPTSADLSVFPSCRRWFGLRRV